MIGFKLEDVSDEVLTQLRNSLREHIVSTQDDLESVITEMARRNGLTQLVLDT